MPSESVTKALGAIARGEIVIVMDSKDRENEGDLILAAEHATAEKIAFLLRYTSGLVCAALPGNRLDSLGLPLMVARNQESQKTAFTVSVDAATGITTGISAADRSVTLNSLADPATRPDQLVRPGHVFPLRSAEFGVLTRPGHTEAACDLARLAGLEPAGVLSEVVSADRRQMAGETELRCLARRHALPLLTVAELTSHRLRTERLVDHVADARMPTRFGQFTCHVWQAAIDGTEHAALVLGDLVKPGPVLVRVHSECLTGDVLGSERCDCGTQVDDALRAIANEGRGVLIYLRGHEGRGIGLTHKLHAYNLQDQGLDTVEANLRQGLPVDSRDYGIGAQILAGMGIREVRLLTNNPLKVDALSDYGVQIVERVPLRARVTTHNRAYLETKRTRLGHDLRNFAQRPTEIAWPETCE